MNEDSWCGRAAFKFVVLAVMTYLVGLTAGSAPGS